MTFRPLWSLDSEKVLGNSYGQRSVYGLLWTYANQNYICWPGEKKMTERSGIERTSLSKMISQLAKREVIVIHRCITGRTAKGNCYDLAPLLNRDREQIKALMCGHDPKEQPNNSANLNSSLSSLLKEPNSELTSPVIVNSDARNSELTSREMVNSAPQGTVHSNNTRTKQYKTSEKKETSFSDEDLKLASYLFQKIKQVAPRTKEPDLEKWADTLRLMREQDKIPLDEIQQVFDWANQHKFWKTNVLSPGKLREKFPTLHSQMQNQSKGLKNADTNRKRFDYDPATAGQTNEL